MENRLIKNNNFILVFLGALVSNIGSLLYSFAVSLYLLEISNNNAIIQGSYLAMCGITFVLVSLIGGVIADRFHNGKIMYVCDYIKGIAIAVCTLLIMTLLNSNTQQIVILFVVGFINNVIAAIFSPASSAILPKIVDENNLAKANSWFSILQSCQSIAGIILAGVLYSLINIYSLFFIVGGCYLLSGLSEMFINYDYKQKENKITINDSINEIKGGFLYLLENKYLASVILSCLFINFFISPVFQNLVPFFISTDVTESSYILKNIINPKVYFSLTSIFYSVGALITGLIFTSIVIKKYVKTLKVGLFNVVLGLSIFTLTYIIVKVLEAPIEITMIILLAVCFLIGIATTQTNIPILTMIQATTKKEMIGKVMCFVNIGSQGLVPVATFLAGIVIHYFNIQGLLSFCTLGFIVSYVFVLLNKNIKEENINMTKENN